MSILYTVSESLLFQKEILLCIFGGLVLIYVIATIYGRMKMSGRKMQNVTAKVTSIEQVKVQSNHHGTSADQFMCGEAAAFGGRFNVTLTDEKTGEVYVFAISESVSEKLSIGKVGRLCFKGEEFISFDAGQEQEKSYRLRKSASTLLIGGILIGGWGIIHFYPEEKSQEESIVIEETTKDLKIYMFSYPMYYGNEIISNTSRYNLGEFGSLTEEWGNTAYMYYDATESYMQN